MPTPETPTQKLAAPDLERLFFEPLDGVIETVADDDEMFAGNLEHYVQVGESALRCIRTGLLGAGRGAPRSILDMPCGHGRVLRVLKAAYPEAALTACDILRGGVEFCADTFDATPVYAEIIPARTPLPDRYDLIWCGSLLTHFSEEAWESLFQLFSSSLEPGGVAVATVQGRRSIDKIRNGDYLGLEQYQAEELLARYFAEGFAYCDYEYRPGYGISLSSGSWAGRFIERFPELRLVTYIERGWDSHQDVIAVQRVDPEVQGQHEEMEKDKRAVLAGKAREAEGLAAQHLATEQRLSELENELASRIESHAGELATLRAEHGEQQEVIATLEKDLAGHRSVVAELRRVADETRVGSADLARQLAQAQEQLRTAHERLGEQNEKLRALEADVRSRLRSLARVFGPKPA